MAGQNYKVYSQDTSDIAAAHAGVSELVPLEANYLLSLGVELRAIHAHADNLGLVVDNVGVDSMRDGQLAAALFDIETRLRESFILLDKMVAKGMKAKGKSGA